jgi:hypothetical protein
VAELWCLEKTVVVVNIWIQGGRFIIVLDCSFGSDYWIRLGELVLSDYEVKGNRTAPFKQKRKEKGK